ncbi:hypothetical protein AAE02nite_45630 [Adhaeribacter aerolatus]|uniref:Uncharacterized protein n=2 Tax=Adhaeribacter aerolatus TaxID=670289 RepID=A0A512B4L3_9BACT|nr:hypothetical protein AAE02nite_45630 [Adhaeribacter aerolatus]
MFNCSPQQKTEEKEPATLNTPAPLPSETTKAQNTAPATIAGKTKVLAKSGAGKKKENKTYELLQRQLAGFKFEAFAVKDKYQGQAAPLDLVSHEDARLYRKTLTRGLATGSNFAGKYTLVSIDCGSPCLNNYIIETQTGKVVDKVQSNAGISYRPDSRLLLVNPPSQTTNYEACPECRPAVYVMENGLLYTAKLIR